jgi:hypothetical protein
MRSLRDMANPYQRAPDVSIVRTDTCTNRTAAFRSVHTVGFGSGCPDLSCCPPLYIFRGSMTRPVFSPSLCFGHRVSAIALRLGCRPDG